MLFDRSNPEMQLSLVVLIPTIVLVSSIVIISVIVRRRLKAKRAMKKARVGDFDHIADQARHLAETWDEDD